MAEKKRILIQLDSDAHPSVFDRVVAVDAGVDELFSYGGVTPADVRDLVHGAIFTRGPKDLKSTAIFIGGSDVARGEELFREAKKAFFGPLRVSLLLDCGGANTTAAAAVLAAHAHLDLAETTAVVLGATGPVGRRVSLLLARAGARVRAGSRRLERADDVASAVRDALPGAAVEPIAPAGSAEFAEALDGAQLVVAAGGAGVELLPLATRRAAADLRVAIDLNAVPPVGIEGVDSMDAGADRDGVLAYGAIGVGGKKMKIHKAAVARLFESNDQALDAAEVFDLGAETVGT